VGYDVDPVTTPLGDEFQWLTVSAAVNLDKWWVPGVRFGWRQNLAGTELGYLGVGATLFRFLNLDLATALESVTLGGDTLPRGLVGSLGFQFNF
jgi:hypothetical protein